MGLFPRFDEEGPESGSDAPRKTGLPRLWEMVSRDLWDDFRAGFLALLGCAPLAVMTAAAVAAGSLPLALLLGFAGGAAAGPELCALADTLLRGLRDEPGFWWHTYRRVWRRGLRPSLLPGALSGGLLSGQFFLLLHAGDAVVMTAVLIGMALLMGMSLYLWPQLALMELSFGQLIKNSALLFVAHLPRSAAALAFLAVYIGLSLRFFPLAAALLPLTNAWLPALPALFLIYPGLEASFQIEEKLRAQGRGPERP